MKNVLTAISIVFILLVACISAPTGAPAPSATPVPTSALLPPATTLLTITPTQISTPTVTTAPPNIRPTDGPIPTSAIRIATRTSTSVPRELTPADVGLIFNPAEIRGTFMIIPCYMFSSDIFHAGDGVYFPSGDSSTKYNVVAPADGNIVRASRISDRIGYEINVQTPFTLDGQTVFYDVLHTSGLREGLRIGDTVHKGDVLAIKKMEHLDPGGNWLVDIGFRNGYKQANASLPDWIGLGYFSWSRLVMDDLAMVDPSRLSYRTCVGNPIEQSKPFATPTPGGFGPYVWQK
jgi:hypothetical protein